MLAPDLASLLRDTAIGLQILLRYGQDESIDVHGLLPSVGDRPQRRCNAGSGLAPAGCMLSENDVTVTSAEVNLSSTRKPRVPI
jgi:hypothetical protein